MALVDNAWYINYGNGSSTGYYALAQWTALTAYTAGQIIRQLAAPAVGSERVFICIIAGTSLAAEPSWTLTRGAKTAEAAGPTWQECSGIAALNGDAANTPSWTISATPPGGVKNTAVDLGQVIKRDNGASYQICTTAGTAGNAGEPSFSDTAGTTTADNTVTWTSLGVVGNFTGWQAPHARIQAAVAANWGGAGDKFFVRSNHAETQAASMTVTVPSAAATPSYVVCVDVNDTALPPTVVTTGASLTTTGANALTVNGFKFVWQGIALNCGTSGTQDLTFGSTNVSESYAIDTAFLLGSGSAQVLKLGTSNSTLTLDNCTLQVGTATCTVVVNAEVTWKNTASAIVGGTLPTTLFPASNVVKHVILNGVDLSALGAGKTLVGANQVTAKFSFVNCKLGSSVTVAGTPTSGLIGIDVVNCDSGATNYRHERYHYTGTQTVETTVVRTGGATDGVTPVAWKIVTTANSKWAFPFESMPLAAWNDTTAANVTVTVYGIWGGGAVPNNDEIWMEVAYPGSSATPIATINTANTKANNLASGTAQGSDSSTWGGSTTAFKMSVTLSAPQPAMKGPIYVTIKAAKASSTFYVDPKIALS